MKSAPSLRNPAEYLYSKKFGLRDQIGSSASRQVLLPRRGSRRPSPCERLDQTHPAKPAEQRFANNHTSVQHPYAKTGTAHPHRRKNRVPACIPTSRASKTACRNLQSDSTDSHILARRVKRSRFRLKLLRLASDLGLSFPRSPGSGHRGRSPLPNPQCRGVNPLRAATGFGLRSTPGPCPVQSESSPRQRAHNLQCECLVKFDEACFTVQRAALGALHPELGNACRMLCRCQTGGSSGVSSIRC